MLLIVADWRVGGESHEACGILVPRIEPVPPALEVQSLNH